MGFQYLGIEQDMAMDGHAAVRSATVGAYDQDQTMSGIWDWLNLFTGKGLDIAPSGAGIITGNAQQQGSNSIKGGISMPTPSTQNKAPAWVSKLPSDYGDWKEYDRALALDTSDIPAGYTVDPVTGEMKRTGTPAKPGVPSPARPGVPSPTSPGVPSRPVNPVTPQQTGITPMKAAAYGLGAAVIFGALFLGYRAMKSNEE